MTTLQRSEPRIFAAVADRALGLAMKSAVLPALFGDDSRYVASRSASGIRRLGYAAAQTVMTRSNDERRHFNAATIGGAGLAAGLSNLYHPAADRTIGATLSRWGTQVLVDALSNELREFGPELRRLFHRTVTTRLQLTASHLATDSGEPSRIAPGRARPVGPDEVGRLTVAPLEVGAIGKEDASACAPVHNGTARAGDAG